MQSSVSKIPATTKEPCADLADLLIEYLSQLSVDFVFGIPGGAIEPLYNALARSKRRGGPRAVLARHETGAAFMADGYFRQTGKLGVCCATTGPGTTNLVTGVASAHENRIPMLVISAQTDLSCFGRGAFQESSCTGINTVSIFDHCTRYSTLVSHPNQFEHKLINAIMTSFRSPMGPTHLSIPWDIFRSASPVSQPRYYLPSLITGEPVLDLAGIDQLSRQLEQARKVVLVVGADCGEAVNEILELATFLGAELVVTPHGKGFIDPYHSLFRGVIGFAGHASAREALTDPAVDTVLAIGSNFSEWASNAWDYAALLNRRLIHVDANEDHFVRSPMARLHVRGRISVILSDVLERLQQGKLAKRPAFRPTLAAANAFPIDGEAETGSSRPGCRVDDEAGFHSEATPITPQALMRELAQLFPPETCFLADTGNSQAWSVHYLHPRGLGSVSPWNHISARYQAAFEFGSMGWAIGASVGMALGFSDYCPVVCITGDGSMLMNGQEITVAVQEKLNVVFVVLNDGWLGMVKHGQRLAGAEQVAVELPRVDFYAQAKALGANAHVIHSPQDLRDLDIAAICNRRWPTLLDVRIDPEAVPPLGLRVGVLRSAS